MRRAPVEDALSAGGVVWRPSPSGPPEIAICVRGKDRRVSLPKGTPEPGEQIEDTARREVSEETGLDVTLGHSLGDIDYWFYTGGRRIHKVVKWWLMRAVGGDVALHDAEFDDVVWVSAEEAHRRLSYAGERQVLERALAILTAEAAK